MAGKESKELKEQGRGGGGVGWKGTGEGVGLVVSSWAVGNGHVGLVCGEVLRPAGLATREVTLAEEVLDGVVVSDESEVLAALEVMAEYLDSMDSCQELLFVDGIIPLGCCKLPGLVAHRL